MTPEEVERAITRLFEGQDLLTGKVTELTENETALTEDVGQMRRSIEIIRDETCSVHSNG